MTSTPGDWRNATGNLGDATTGPDELEVAPALRASRFPRWLVVLASVLVAALVVGAAGLTAWQITASKPDQVVVSSGPRTPWPLVPPLRMGAYSRDANAVGTPSANPTTRKQALATTYSRNGVDSLVLLLSRPESDARKFLTETGLNAVVASGDGYCGTTIDTNRDACAVVRDNTAVTVVDMVGMTRPDLLQLAHQFADEMAR